MLNLYNYAILLFINDDVILIRINKSKSSKLINLKLWIKAKKKKIKNLGKLQNFLMITLYRYLLNKYRIEGEEVRTSILRILSSKPSLWLNKAANTVILTNNN